MAFALAAAVRLAVALQPYVIHVDGAFQYVPAARVFYEKGFRAGLDVREVPVYPCATALVAQAMGGDIERAARIVSLAGGVLGIIPLYFLARRVLGAKVAGVSSLFYACSPLMVTNAVEVTKEALFGALFLTGLWLGWLALAEHQWRRRWWLCLLAGTAGALAYLTRPDGVALVMVWGLWLAVEAARGLLRERGRALYTGAAGLLILLPWLSLAGPYLAHINRGKAVWDWELSPKKKTEHILGERQRRREDRERRRAEEQGAPAPDVEDLLKYRLGRAASSAGEIARETYNELGPAFFLFLLVGLAARRRRLFRGGELYLLLVCLLLLSVAYLIARNLSRFEGIRLIASRSDFSGRHLLGVLLAGWVWLAAGYVLVENALARLFEGVARRAGWPGGPRGRDVVGAVLLGIVVVGFLPSALTPPHADKMPRKEAGLWLGAYVKEQALPAPVIMTHARRIAYYAGVPRENVISPSEDWTEDLPRWVRKAREEGARYLALEQRDVAGRAAEALERLAREGSLRLLHATGREKHDIVIYEVLPPGSTHPEHQDPSVRTPLEGLEGCPPSGRRHA